MGIVLHIGPINSRGGMSRTIKAMIDNPPDGWSAFGLESHVDGSPWSKLRVWRKSLRRLNHMVSDLGVDIIHVHTASDISWLRKRSFIKRSLKLGIPVVVSIHAGDFHEFCASSFGLFGLDVRNTMANENVFPVSLSSKGKDLFSQWTGTSTIIVPNFVMRPKKINSQKNRKFGRLLFVGRDSKEKRVTLAIQIANALHSRGLDTSLVLAGVEKDSRSLRDARNGVDVDARGWLDQTSVSELIDSSWSLLVTSEYEALPMCVIEAMSSGLPIIGSEAIEGLFSNSGIIVNSNDPEIWALRISELLEDHDKWQSLSKSGPRESTIFDADRVRESWLILYNSIIMQANDL